jgi:HK97 family phage major capsid protein
MEMQEVKTALDEAGRLYKGQFEDINNKIKALEAKGAAVDPLLKEQRDRLNEAIEKASALNEQFIAQQATIQRLEKFGIVDGLEGRDKLEAETKAFNVLVRSTAAAQSKQAPAPITTEDYQAYKKSFARYLRVGEKGLTPDEFRAMSVGSDLNGGYLVDPDETGQMVKKIFETSDVRRYASVQSISTDALEGSADLDEASGGWVSELGTRSDSTTPTVPQPWRIPVFELYSQPKASQKLINDASIDVAGWLNGKVSDKLSRLQNTAFVTGRASDSRAASRATPRAPRMRGARRSMSRPARRPRSAPTPTRSEAELADGAPEGIVRAWFRVLHDAADQVRDSQPDGCVSAGKFVFIPSFHAGVPDTILGAPIYVLQDMANYTTASALGIAYGNMARYYQIVDRQGISVLVDPFTSKPYVVFYTTARVGAMSWTSRR